jgi:hypothetical protein
LPVLPPSAGGAVGAAAPGSAGQPLGINLQLWMQRFDQPLLPGSRSVSSDYARGVIDFRHVWQLSDSFRITASDRLDRTLELDAQQGAPSSQYTINSLRELYGSWRFGNPAAPFYLDFGRINLREGVGSGYNPTDFFKARAVQTTVSLDPTALRVDRLGVVMATLQSVADWGTVTVAAVPRLTNKVSTGETEAPFSLAFDRTNGLSAGLIKISPQINERLSADAILFQREDEDLQTGLNLSLLLNDATVLNLEYAGGRLLSLPAPNMAAPNMAEPPRSWANRLAANVVWTSPFGPEFTLEAEYASNALSAKEWNDWRHVNSLALATRLNGIITQQNLLQEPLVQLNGFGRVSWTNAFGRTGLNLAGFALVNAYDGSVLWQIEVSQSLNSTLSLNAQFNGFEGRTGTEFGSGGHRFAIYLSASF